MQYVSDMLSTIARLRNKAVANSFRANNRGSGACRGAGSVVTKDVEGYTVVAGNSARKINAIDNLPYQV